MKKFFKDYADLCKESGRFYKEHWLGCIVMTVVVTGAEVGWFFRRDIKDAIEDKLEERRNKKVEEA